MKPSRAWMSGVRRRAHLAWLGSQQGRLHREQADGGSILPEPNLTQGPARNLALLPGLSPAPTNVAKSPSSLPVLRSPSLGTTFVAPFSPTVVGSIPSRCKSSVLSLLKNAGSSATLGSQMRHRFCTLAGDQSVTNSGDDDDSKFQRGDVQALRKRIVEDTSHTTAKVLDFQTRYKNYLRPQLVSPCLISPCPINDRWMVFLQRQTFEICGHNPSYLSCFDIMCYEHGCKDGEWELFLNHLLDKKVYVIEDWDSSYDASFDSVTNTASFSYIIWKDDQIVYSEVFSGLVCSSPVEAP
ncbi:uncharacterized protein [Triticum aestivum]|uniref:uncharacterized protein n=1 Tax=Triticum aestivum TaxID=4565 RepID=UPI001D0353EB|nr:uncharacterized protein LOC123099421 [Triticum aestivum]XP_044377516.1 uncharacterized protein LOC123099421 [Triticum aestivum]